MNLLQKLRYRWYKRQKRLRTYFEDLEMSSVTIKTKHAPWVNYKTSVATEAALGVTERKGIAVNNETYYVIPEAMNNLEARISCTSQVAGKTGVARFYGARYLNRKNDTFDDISLIGTVSITSGTQVATSGNLYVHQMVLTDIWITEVKVADGLGNNGMSRLAFDTSGYDVFFIRIEDSESGSYSWLSEVSGW